MRKRITDPRLLALYRTVGNNVIRHRGAMSYVELSQKTGLSRATLSAVERGLNVELETLVRIADALNVHPALLFVDRVSAASFEDAMRQIAREEFRKMFSEKLIS